ncbi:MAG TPA: hypothetical protein VFT66_08895 [Roseiflexaceae bacterium]|nr:hypothetical protein [Roseiflexaceae bacterium]
MNGIALQPQKQLLDVGDRIYVRRGRQSISVIVNQQGTVVEVFRVPQGSCMVRIDGDLNLDREWFLYRDEVMISGR